MPRLITTQPSIVSRWLTSTNSASNLVEPQSVMTFATLSAASAVSQEKDRRTFVLLLLTDMRDYEIVLAADWPAVVTYWIPRLIYCFLLALGIWLSMLRQQEVRKRSDRPAGRLARLRAIAGVWTFFGLLHVWLVDPPIADAARRARFFASLLGF